jgi:hypothetical protein
MVPPRPSLTIRVRPPKQSPGNSLWVALPKMELASFSPPKNCRTYSNGGEGLATEHHHRSLPLTSGGVAVRGCCKACPMMMICTSRSGWEDGSGCPVCIAITPSLAEGEEGGMSEGVPETRHSNAEKSSPEAPMTRCARKAIKRDLRS